MLFFDLFVVIVSVPFAVKLDVVSYECCDCHFRVTAPLVEVLSMECVVNLLKRCQLKVNGVQRKCFGNWGDVEKHPGRVGS